MTLFNDGYGGNSMKTIVSILVSFVAVVACCLALQCNAVKASAYYELSVIATEEVISGTYTGNVGTTGYLYTTVTVPITNDN